jgi:cysteine desulfurase/selenocysteine lyase
MSYDVEKIRADFPILHQKIKGHPLVYLDNAATTQKPQQVIAALDHYYRCLNANVHRGVHTLSEEATAAYEAARVTVQQFIHAQSEREIVFCRGTTEAINLVAQSFARPQLKPGDEILISAMEHHSNIVPWQMVCEQTGASLRVAPINEHGEIIVTELQALLSSKTKLVAVNHISNALGTINPVQDIIAMAHQVGAKVLIDGAQSLAAMPVDVQALDCDFYTGSGHKLFAPTGIGFLYAKAELLEAMPPYQGGGDMIRQVTFERTTYAPIPVKFEAGTPNIAGAIGLAKAIDYIQAIGLSEIHGYEQQLLTYATEQFKKIKGLRLIGTAEHKACILSFVIDGVHPHDMGTVLDHQGIAVRTGHHCAMPLMKFFKVPATVRASFSIYNTREEVDKLVTGINKVKEMFANG